MHLEALLNFKTITQRQSLKQMQVFSQLHDIICNTGASTCRCIKVTNYTNILQDMQEYSCSVSCTQLTNTIILILGTLKYDTPHMYMYEFLSLYYFSRCTSKRILSIILYPFGQFYARSVFRFCFSYYFQFPHVHIISVELSAIFHLDFYLHLIPDFYQYFIH